MWVGTRFVASIEAGAPPIHKQSIVKAGYDDIVRTVIYTGRPMSVLKTPYTSDWYACLSLRLLCFPEANSVSRETRRRGEIETLTSKGLVPHNVELEKYPEKSLEGRTCTSSTYF